MYLFELLFFCFLQINTQKWKLLDHMVALLYHLSHQGSRNAGDLGLILGPRRSPGEGNGYLRQYSRLGHSMDRRAWQVTVHEVAKSWT